MKSIREINQERRKRFQSDNNMFNEFPVGQRVMVITKCQDFTFFRGDETGVVTSNSKKYLGVTVKFDKPIEYADGTVMEGFNFQPYDLITEEFVNALIFEARSNDSLCDLREELVWV